MTYREAGASWRPLWIALALLAAAVVLDVVLPGPDHVLAWLASREGGSIDRAPAREERTVRGAQRPRRSDRAEPAMRAANEAGWW